MNLLVDESVDRQIVKRLRQEGHDVVYVAELAPSISDEEVLQQANSRSALLATSDKDFGELVFRQHRIHAGVVLLRLAGLPAATKAETVARVFRDHAPELISAFTVISPGVVRIRPSDVSVSDRPSAEQKDDAEGINPDRDEDTITDMDREGSEGKGTR